MRQFLDGFSGHARGRRNPKPEGRNPKAETSNAETQRTQRGKAATELIDVRGHAEHSEDGGSRMEDGGD
jgi:hypothetical protein